MSDFAEIDNTSAKLFSLTRNVAYASHVWSKSSSTASIDEMFVGRKIIRSAMLDQSVICNFQTSGLNGERYIGFWKCSATDLATMLTPSDLTKMAFGFKISTAAALTIFESGSQVNNPSVTLGNGYGIRVQIVSVSGTYTVKYYYRTSSGGSWTLAYTSLVTSTNIINSFPLGIKGSFLTQNGTFVSPDIEITDVTTSNPVLTDLDASFDQGAIPAAKSGGFFAVAIPSVPFSDAATIVTGLPTITQGQAFPTGLR